MDKTQAILASLGQLDPANDEHWTAGGLPATKALEQLTGISPIARADVEAAAPGYTRDIGRAAASNTGQATAAPEPAPVPADPASLAEQLKAVDPAVLSAALKLLPAAPAEETPIPAVPADLLDCNAQTLAVHAEQAAEEERIRKVVDDAIKTSRSGE